MDEFLGGDSMLNGIDIKIQYIQGMIDFLESVMGQLKSRDFQISNAVKWKMFISGA